MNNILSTENNSRHATLNKIMTCLVKESYLISKKLTWIKKNSLTSWSTNKGKDFIVSGSYNCTQ